MAVGMMPSASTMSCAPQPQVTIRSGFFSIVVSPRALFTVTGKAPSLADVPESAGPPALHPVSTRAAEATIAEAIRARRDRRAVRGAGSMVLLERGMGCGTALAPVDLRQA